MKVEGLEETGREIRSRCWGAPRTLAAPSQMCTSCWQSQCRKESLGFPEAQTPPPPPLSAGVQRHAWANHSFLGPYSWCILSMNFLPGSGVGAVPFTSRSFQIPRGSFSFWDPWGFAALPASGCFPIPYLSPPPPDQARLSPDHQGETPANLGLYCLVIYKPKRALEGSHSSCPNNVCSARELPELFKSSQQDSQTQLAGARTGTTLPKH